MVFAVCLLVVGVRCWLCVARFFFVVRRLPLLVALCSVCVVIGSLLRVLCGVLLSVGG